MGIDERLDAERNALSASIESRWQVLCETEFSQQVERMSVDVGDIEKRMSASLEAQLQRQVAMQLEAVHNSITAARDATTSLACEIQSEHEGARKEVSEHLSAELSSLAESLDRKLCLSEEEQAARVMLQREASEDLSRQVQVAESGLEVLQGSMFRLQAHQLDAAKALASQIQEAESTSESLSRFETHTLSEVEALASELRSA